MVVAATTTIQSFKKLSSDAVPRCVLCCVAFKNSTYEFSLELIKSNEIRNRFVFRQVKRGWEKLEKERKKCSMEIITMTFFE